MSKIGKKPIIVPAGVQVVIKDSFVSVKGPKGEMALTLHPKVTAKSSEKGILVGVKTPENMRQAALWGTFRSLLSNMVLGVSEGFVKRLEIVGVGFKAQVTANKLILNLGYSHPIELVIPQGLEVKVEKNTLSISGTDKQAVGQFAAIIRSQRAPEPYKGKGVKYFDEVIRRKAGKVVKAVGG